MGPNRSVVAVVSLCACLVVSCSERSEGESSAPSARIASAMPKASASASTPQDPKAAAADYVATMQGVAEVFAQNENACGGLAEKLREYRHRHASVLDAPKPALFGIIEADDALREKMKKAMATVMDGSMACRDNPAFRKLHAELEARLRKAGL